MLIIYKNTCQLSGGRCNINVCFVSQKTESGHKIYIKIIDMIFQKTNEITTMINKEANDKKTLKSPVI